MLRVGLLYRAGYLLRVIHEKSPLREELVTDIPFFRGIPIQELLDVVEKGDWVQYGDDGQMMVTEAGKNIAIVDDPVTRLRKQVMTLVTTLNPPWISIINLGRGSLASYVPPEELQCLEEAGLLDSVQDEIVRWWDELALRGRAERESRLLEIGRIGEKLSFDFEERRTGVRPKWIALEYTDAGYDLLSIISSEDPSRLLIEVKTSNQLWENAVLLLTRNEWAALESSRNAVIHLWAIAYDPPRHLVIDIEGFKSHIPSDKGNGEWVKMKCPFSVFSDS